MNRPERFKELFAYDTWATAQTMGSIASVPAERRTSPQFLRALQIAAHVQVARHVWLERLHGRPAGPGIDFFPSWALERISDQAAELDARFFAYLDRTSDQDLDSEIHYTSSEGMRYSSTVEDVVTHIVNHATYHRGQIARLVTESGGLRASTDFIALTRRQL